MVFHMVHTKQMFSGYGLMSNAKYIIDGFFKSYLCVLFAALHFQNAFSIFSIYQGCYKYSTASKMVVQNPQPPFRLILNPSHNQNTTIVFQSCHHQITASLPISTQDIQFAKLY